MLRMGFEREGDPTGCVLNARCGEAGDFDRWVVSATYFPAGLPSRLSPCERPTLAPPFAIEEGAARGAQVGATVCDRRARYGACAIGLISNG
jgi:hypothetical protein